MSKRHQLQFQRRNKVNKYMKRCSILLETRKTQIKRTRNFFILSNRQNFKKDDNTTCWEEDTKMDYFGECILVLLCKALQYYLIKLRMYKQLSITQIFHSWEIYQEICTRMFMTVLLAVDKKKKTLIKVGK